MDDAAKEVLRKQVRQVAEYCGVQILTYAILSNHFHILVHVPKRDVVTDAELLRRYRILYPRPTAHQTARLETIRSELQHEGPEAVVWRRRQLALMGDVSQYMKLLKQRFSIWFNRTHGRFGTLWAERFKSALIEIRKNALQTVAAYIDLNSVRAGLVADPKEYRFCGYAEAVADSQAAQVGLHSIMGGRDWPDAQASYRELVFGTGASPRDKASTIAPEDFQRVFRQQGNLSLATLLRCRMRYLSDGAVLGTWAFVELQLARYRTSSGRRDRSAPRPLPPCAEWADLATLRGLRGQT